MARILTTIHLSDLQKEVLSKVMAAPNAHVAWSELLDSAESIDDNIAAARDVLGNLGLLKVGDGVLEVTDKGIEVMTDENLIDETGQLTELGRQLAQIDRDQPQQPGTQYSTPPGDTADVPPPPGGNEELGGLPMESLSLLRTINEQAEIVEHLKLLKESTKITPQLVQQIVNQTYKFLQGEVDYYDMAPVTQQAIYDAFIDNMPQGVASGDESTVDEWLYNQDPNDVLEHLERFLLSKMKKGTAV